MHVYYKMLLLSLIWLPYITHGWTMALLWLKILLQQNPRALSWQSELVIFYWECVKTSHLGLFSSKSAISLRKVNFGKRYWPKTPVPSWYSTCEEMIAFGQTSIDLLGISRHLEPDQRLNVFHHIEFRLLLECYCIASPRSHLGKLWELSRLPDKMQSCWVLRFLSKTVENTFLALR